MVFGSATTGSEASAPLAGAEFPDAGEVEAPAAAAAAWPFAGEAGSGGTLVLSTT